jgi:hypothetical protein
MSALLALFRQATVSPLASRKSPLCAGLLELEMIVGNVLLPVKTLFVSRAGKVCVCGLAIKATARSKTKLEKSILIL